MNIFLAQSEKARAELEYISATEHNMIGAQASKPIITIVQDALLSTYIMTNNPNPIEESDFFQLTMACDSKLNTGGGYTYEHIQSKLELAQKVFTKFGKNYPKYCGKSLFSLLLPHNLNYDYKNKASPTEPSVKIYKGILYEGVINKDNLKSGHESLILMLHKEYSPSEALHFVNNVQFLANAYMLYHGFSIGIGDCVIKTGTDQIKQTVAKCFIEAASHEESTSNKYIREAKVNMSLNKAKDIGMKIAKDSLDVDNNFISTVTSGSKGGYFNIAQIMGLLGQQNITGQRVKCHLNKGRRTLPHYPIDHTLASKDVEYQSRGFITSSFLKGLTPQEFWFHSMSSREGITDTAMKTAQSGYIQRKMVKIMEDVQVKYDQSVRNSVGSIIQFAYGNDNLCGTETTLQNGSPFICNVSRISEMLNMDYELENNVV